MSTSKINSGAACATAVSGKLAVSAVCKPASATLTFQPRAQAGWCTSQTLHPTCCQHAKGDAALIKSMLCTASMVHKPDTARHISVPTG